MDSFVRTFMREFRNDKPFLNEVFLARLDELILEGEKQWEAQASHEKHKIMDIVGFARWATSSLNLLEYLVSASSST
jgi:hypothetical protein